MAESTLVKTEYESGYIITTDQSGNRTRHPIAAVLRAADIPVGLTYTQVASIKALANMMVIVIRTLIDRQILDETFADELGLDMDLDHMIAAFEAMGGSYADPTLETADE